MSLTLITKVYISGIKGLHPIPVAIPYFYRGHFLYDAEGFPLEPMTYTTGKGKVIISRATSTAPLYDPLDPSFVDEESIHATLALQLDDPMKPQPPSIFGPGAECVGKDSIFSGQGAIFTEQCAAFASSSLAGTPNHTLSSLILTDNTFPASLEALHSFSNSPKVQFNIPHGRAHNLAVSAPVSVGHKSSRSSLHTDQSTGLRTTPSSSNLQKYRLLEDAHIPSRSRFSPNDLLFLGSAPMSMSVSRGPSVEPSCESSREPSPGLYASSAMKRAYDSMDNNATITKCPLHGDGCDGVSTENLTEQMRRERGFAGNYPAFTTSGPESRLILDWETMLKEEKAKIDAAGAGALRRGRF
ncbi:hypothetical protein K469DRAFT_746608 [Zopfia rhizophila CBS 207.26]|uniref:Uncharacterized protein n=1 Tax=Zopfia rhizophila CBS 207.26 TaxID=1314779 RepID=A0A6A6EKB6_9PEZI|nr:hypothetical protein K469DRAFT_746608 [Zopfia rhizophila CBS 207.26]